MVTTNGAGPDSGLAVRVTDLLAFFDEKTSGSERHATSIVAVCGEDLGCGLLKHYLEQQGAQVQILRDPRTGAPLPCTQGKPAGPRLDRWVQVQGSPLLAPDALLQVEVKNWSAHAIGGECLCRNASPEAIAEYRRRSWAKEWDCSTGIRKKSLQKLLEPMCPPAALGHLRREPLACMWVCLHPEGKSECLFGVSLPQRQRGAFSRVWFFSMSAYLRTLACEDIVIEMPDTAKRLQWLSKLLPGR